MASRSLFQTVQAYTLAARCSRSASFSTQARQELRKAIEEKASAANEGKSLAQISAEVFGNNYNPVPERTGNKVLNSKLNTDKLLAWYPPNIERAAKAFGNPVTDFADPQSERWQTKLERLKRRGKGPAKKGEGKRSQRKK